MQTGGGRGSKIRKICKRNLWMSPKQLLFGLNAVLFSNTWVRGDALATISDLWCNHSHNTGRFQAGFWWSWRGFAAAPGNSRWPTSWSPAGCRGSRTTLSAPFLWNWATQTSTPPSHLQNQPGILDFLVNKSILPLVEFNHLILFRLFQKKIEKLQPQETQGFF